MTGALYETVSSARVSGAASPMRAVVSKTFTFDAAHRLMHHDGKCRNLHGHTYKVEVLVAGDVQTTGAKDGMVIDFSDLKAEWAPLMSLLDHHTILEKSDPFVAAFQSLRDLAGVNSLVLFATAPTAENMAAFILAQMPSATLVRVYETPTSYAEVSR